MVMVGTDPVEVERALLAGELVCPCCEGVLRPWGYARRRFWRPEHNSLATTRHWLRRSRCGGCARTHVLLPSSWLVRRADGVAVIGAALLAKASGQGHRPIAAATGRPVSTVRGWLRRFAARAEEHRMFFTRLLHALDPEAEPVAVTGAGTGTGLADAVEAIGRAAAAGVLRLSPGCPWQFTARASGGRLLAPSCGAAGRGRVSNTS
jgi:hypothetical protein